MRVVPVVSRGAYDGVLQMGGHPNHGDERVRVRHHVAATTRRDTGGGGALASGPGYQHGLACAARRARPHARPHRATTAGPPRPSGSGNWCDENTKGDPNTERAILWSSAWLTGLLDSDGRFKPMDDWSNRSPVT